MLWVGTTLAFIWIPAFMSWEPETCTWFTTLFNTTVFLMMAMVVAKVNPPKDGASATGAMEGKPGTIESASSASDGGSTLSSAAMSRMPLLPMKIIVGGKGNYI